MNSAIKIILALGVVSLASCADRFDQSFPVESTAYDSAYAYLDSYAPLKEYLAQSKNPNIHLGVGTSAADYLKKGVVYALTNSNFTETEPGNAMKMASCVNDNGEMDFTTVTNYVNAATEAGLSVYGHTLAWHSQQAKKWLMARIADKPLKGGSGSVGTGTGGNHYVKYTMSKDGVNPWDHQAIYDLPVHMEKGKNYVLTMNVKVSDDAEIAFWPIWNASPNKNQWGGSNDVQYLASYPVAAGDWKKLTWEFTASFDHDRLQFCFGKMKKQQTLGIDNIELVEKGTSKNMVANGDFEDNDLTGWSNNWQGPSYARAEETTGIPQTAEEKKDTLTKAMDRWIKGMMEACQGKVKAWDVVNEAISGQDKDGDGYYDLQSASRGTVSKEDAKANFYWQDYLGDIDYVRTAVRLARQYGPKDVKLFINDYNLESDWDNNMKLKSLIHWIQQWEADGVTKIDGIGSQMHITCYMNKQVEESKKNAIVNMLKLLAQSGKLVRISELDMCLVDENGNNVHTADVTEEQHHAMADLYKFVVSKYLEIIPVAQQWGICQWCATDSPANSGWLANSPTGLWDLNYNRKHTYAGFADGLQGK